MASVVRADGYSDWVGAFVYPIFRFFGVLGILYSLLLILIGLTAVCIIPAGSVRFTAARIQLEGFNKALEKYRLDCGDYPDSSTGLKALVSNSGVLGWNGAYIRGPLRDPWNRPFLYEVTGGVAIVRTLGADGKPGGDLYDTDLSSEAPFAPIQESAFHAAQCYFNLRIAPWLLLVASVGALMLTVPNWRPTS